jgi:hypothetical protein
MRKFVHNAAIDLARPVETESKAEGTIPDSAEAVFVNVNEAEICRDPWGKSEGLASANVVGHAFEPLEKLQAQEPQKTNEKNYGEGDQTRNKFERLGLHDMRRSI